MGENAILITRAGALWKEANGKRLFMAHDDNLTFEDNDGKVFYLVSLVTEDAAFICK